MIQSWWIRRWYFLYINACIVLHIVALSKSFQFRYITFYTNNIFFTRHCFTNNLPYTNSFYMVIHLTIQCSLIYTYHLILSFLKWFTRQSKLQGSWLNIFSNISHEFRFHKTNVSHRHFYADVPIFTCVFRKWCIGLIKTYLGGPVP